MCADSFLQARYNKGDPPAFLHDGGKVIQVIGGRPSRACVSVRSAESAECGMKRQRRVPDVSHPERRPADATRSPLSCRGVPGGSPSDGRKSRVGGSGGA